MKPLTLPLTIFAIVALAVGGAAAQKTAQIDPEAMAALQKMGAYLRTLKAFQVEAVTSAEDVLEDGQKVQFSGETNLLARMPDRLRVTIDSDRRDRLMVYDGKQLTVLAR